MPKREMSKEEYEEQQFYYRYNMMDPIELQKKFDNKIVVNSADEEMKRQQIEELKTKLFNLIKSKYIDTGNGKDSKKCLTKSQKQALELFLKGKKQEHAGAILNVTQEAVHSRLEIAKTRLRKICNKDSEINKILLEIKNLMIN